jgi:hypothetical protein
MAGMNIGPVISLVMCSRLKFLNCLKSHSFPGMPDLPPETNPVVIKGFQTAFACLHFIRKIFPNPCFSATRPNNLSGRL